MINSALTLLIDVSVTPSDGLEFLLPPEPFGKIRRDAFETELNNFIESWNVARIVG